MKKKQQLLDWLKNEKTKDKIQVEKDKEIFIKQIKGLTKKDLFPEKKKTSLWQKIKLLIWG